MNNQNLGKGKITLILEDFPKRIKKLRWGSIVTISKMPVFEIPCKDILYATKSNEEGVYYEKYDLSLIYRYIEIPFNKNYLKEEEKISFLIKCLEKEPSFYKEIFILAKEENLLYKILERINKKVILNIERTCDKGGKAVLKIVAFKEGLSYIYCINKIFPKSTVERGFSKFIYPIETEFYISVINGASTISNCTKDINADEEQHLYWLSQNVHIS